MFAVTAALFLSWWASRVRALLKRTLSRPEKVFLLAQCRKCETRPTVPDLTEEYRPVERNRTGPDG